MSNAQISVIIPCWKEDLAVALEVIKLHEGAEEVEWIIAMACPPEGWEELVGEVKAPFKLVECAETGRGNQMNEGAAYATGEILLFHHCDTALEDYHLSALRALDLDTVDAGAFHRVLDERHLWHKQLDPIVRWYNRRWGIMFGDQSFFIRKAFFQEVGGYRPIKLLEDVELSRRVRKKGRVKLLDPPIISSGRRGEKFSSWAQVSALNVWIILLFSLGMSPDRLHEIYYRSWNKK